MFLCFCVFRVFVFYVLMINFMKKNYLVLILLAGGLMLAGCANSNQQGNQNANTSGQQERGEVRGVMFSGDNFSEAAITDLIVGLRVMVFGTENSDKSVTADRIIIGDSKTDFDEMFRRPTTTLEGESGAEAGTRVSVTPPANMPEEMRQNMERFQNMPEEERAQFREQMAQQGGGAAMQRRAVGGLGGGAQRVAGEILSIEDGTIIIKLEDGGSRLIFVTEKTAVLKMRE